MESMHCLYCGCEVSVVEDNFVRCYACDRPRCDDCITEIRGWDSDRFCCTDCNPEAKPI